MDTETQSKILVTLSYDTKPIDIHSTVGLWGDSPLSFDSMSP